MRFRLGGFRQIGGYMHYMACMDIWIYGKLQIIKQWSCSVEIVGMAISVCKSVSVLKLYWL